MSVSSWDPSVPARDHPSTWPDHVTGITLSRDGGALGLYADKAYLFLTAWRTKERKLAINGCRSWNKSACPKTNRKNLSLGSFGAMTVVAGLEVRRPLPWRWTCDLGPSKILAAKAYSISRVFFVAGTPPWPKCSRGSATGFSSSVELSAWSQSDDAATSCAPQMTHTPAMGPQRMPLKLSEAATHPGQWLKLR